MNSVTAHLPKGVAAHRRQKPLELEQPLALNNQGLCLISFGNLEAELSHSEEASANWNAALTALSRSRLSCALGRVHEETSADYLLASGLKLSNALLPVEPLVRQVQYLFIPSNQYLARWSQYCQNHPERCSLNLAPSWTNKQQLAQQVSPQSYQLLVKLINGQRTLRDLAFLTNQDVRRFSCSLIPYLRQREFDRGSNPYSFVS